MLLGLMSWTFCLPSLQELQAALKIQTIFCQKYNFYKNNIILYLM